MTELVVSTVLLGTLLAAAVPTLRWVGSEQHAIDHRQIAMLEAENLMDKITSQEWDRIDPRYATTLKISDEAQRQLTDAKLDISVTPSTDANAKRVSLSLSWQERKRLPVAPIRLTTWVYRRGRSE
jgi:hypothetical protein